MRRRLHVHQTEVVGGGCRVVTVSGWVVAGQEQLGARCSVLERRRRVGAWRWRRLHRLRQTRKVELVRVALTMHLQYDNNSSVVAQWCSG